jgi:hypothetical protein
MTPAGFPHSDTPGSTLGCQLPRAYRRLLRPSSALDAKASTTCPSQLVTHTTNPHHPTTPPAHTQQTNRQQRGWDGQAMHTNTPQRTNTHRPINRRMHTTNTQPPHPHPPGTPTTKVSPGESRAGAARCSRPLSRSQTTTPHPTGPHLTCEPAEPGGAEAPHSPYPAVHRVAGLIPQNPNSVPADPHPTRTPIRAPGQG